jgi:hypothetical protein
MGPSSGSGRQSRASSTSASRTAAEGQRNGSVLQDGVMNCDLGMVKHNRS